LWEDNTMLAKTLREVLEKNKDKYIEALRGFVECNTQVIGHGIKGGNEANGQVFIEKILNDMGAKVERNQMRDEVIREAIRLHEEGNPGHAYENRYNLIATVEGTENGKSMIFNGHIDTMPIVEPESWIIDPYKPRVIDGKLYGRGACDCKGGLMGSIMALQLIKDAGMEPPGDVIIMSVVDEEGGGNGTVEAMMDGYRADAAIVTEPTGNHIQIAHVGFVLMEIKVVGKSLHSAELWNGVNAIEKAMYLIEGMKAVEYKWMTHYRNGLVPPPTLNIGVINGGKESSVVPEECSVKVCIHYPPRTMTKELVVKEFKEAMAERADGDAWLKEHPPEIYVYQQGNAYQIGDDEALVGEVTDILEKELGYKPPVEGSTYATDTRILQNIGGIPSITIGPGYIEQAHGPDEYVSIDEYLEHILICASIMLNWGKKR